MNMPIHPSPEQLSAYFDNEIPEAERVPVETHLSSCSECSGWLEWFEQTSLLGPVVEESLPGDAYWTDLPDRILARLAADKAETSRTARRPRSPSFWQRLWSPQGGWKLALGTAGLVVLVVVVGKATDRWQTQPKTQGMAELAVPDESPIGDGGADLNPEDFAERVILTLGGRGDMGVSLDLRPGQAVPPSGPSGLGTQVGTTPYSLSPQSRAEAGRVVSYGCGENPAERVFMYAVLAEEAGNDRLAGQGYALVRSLVDPRLPLYCEADYRLTYLHWRDRIHNAEGVNPAETLKQLQGLADQKYEAWQRTKTTRDCRTAWCMNRVYLKLSRGMARDVPKAADRLRNLQFCVSC